MNANEKHPPVQTLERVLTEQLSFYEQYACLLEKDSDWMTKLQIGELEKSNKAKNTLLLKIQTMDQARQNLVKSIALEYGIQADTIRIADICEFLSQPEGERLLDLRAKLHSIFEKLQTLQVQTSALATHSLQWINGSMATLKRLLTPTGTYNLQGKVDHPATFSGRMVARQA